MVTVLKETDAVVIGMGWTGSILSRELTKAGLHVVGLERGAMRTPREDFTIPSIRDELKYSNRHELFQDTALETVSLRHNTRETALPIRRSRLIPAGQQCRRRGFALERRDMAPAGSGLHCAVALHPEIRPQRHSR